MWQVKSVGPWGCKVAMRSLLLAGTALLVPLALAPAASAQERRRAQADIGHAG